MKGTSIFICLLIIIGVTLATAEEKHIVVRESSIGEIIKIGDKISALSEIFEKSQIKKGHHLKELFEYGADYYSLDIDMDSDGNRDIEVRESWNDPAVIGKLTVFGEQFKTPIGIGPGDTLDDLSQATKIKRIFHGGTGVGVRTVDLKRGFYILDSAELDWNPENPESIPINDVSKNTKIVGVYIY